MRLLRDYPLDEFNTLRLPARAHYYVHATSERQVAQASDWARDTGTPLLLLGGGSNLVLAGDFPGAVLHLDLQGVQVEPRGGQQRLRVAAGENWPRLVEHCLEQGWHGLENLSLIPGSAGAAPVQNIGAYGVELAQRVRCVHGWHRDLSKFQTLSGADCRFGYRDSIFKGVLRDRFIITAVELELERRFRPVLDYPALGEALAEVSEPSARQVADAVIALRRERLPDPAQLPNAGSFFKNPVLAEADYRRLCEREQTDAIPRFPVSGGVVKVPAAWLLERAGWKGVRRGAAGTHTRQALVLVNHGGATGAEVLALAQEIRADIRRRFGIELELEPRVYGRDRR